MATSSEDPGCVEKLMSLTYDEFLRSITVLSGSGFSDEPEEGRTIRLETSRGHVEVQYDKRPNARLGGLLELPQAKVTLRFFGLDNDETQEFIKMFDQAFQRGGG